MTDYYKPLTYQPKIEAVLNGTCRQTIRYHKPGKKMPVAGDTLTLFTWSGKPYRSPWGTRTKFTLTDPYRLRLYVYDKWGYIANYQGDKIDEMHLNTIARLDGIQPPVWDELLKVLLQMLKGKELVYDEETMSNYYPLVVWR